MESDGTTIGIWVGPNETDVVEEFDERMNSGRGTYSRSESVKEAMRLAVMIEDVLESRGYGGLDYRDREATVRQALIDHLNEIESTQGP